MQQSNQLLPLMDITIMTSLPLLLHYLPRLFLKIPNHPSIPLIIIPLILISITSPLSPPFIIPLLIPALHLINNPIIPTPVQPFLHYFLPSLLISLTPLFSPSIKKPIHHKNPNKQFFYIILPLFLPTFF
ncbi:energy-coupled thiamine transporter ThiT, partial [Bacillus altitudinis]|uniref:energy-coupled thiamine transporter ThiT n=1 Tax=Bacillus altitudinis TaxID=293387 RepID=UPI0011A7B150